MSSLKPARTLKTLTTPTVHLNGTGARQLAEQYETAYRALTAALEALAAARPHGRDYYVQNPDAYTAARDEHQVREQAVEAVRDEIEALYHAVQG